MPPLSIGPIEPTATNCDDGLVLPIRTFEIHPLTIGAVPQNQPQSRKERRRKAAQDRGKGKR